ncbi:MAG: hypothetical protein LBU43_05815 [Candidatus Accumulibacter sp.]|nr:hypothetical protein [Accumulibacter sp.]
MIDRYDFDAAKHVMLPNPDYGSKAENAVDPHLKATKIPHKYLQKILANHLASDYDVESNPWDVTNSRVIAPEIIQTDETWGLQT